MDELTPVTLIARFPDVDQLDHTLEELAPPYRAVALFPNGSDEADALAERYELERDLERDDLDAGIAERLAWHLEQADGPLLAVEVMAEQGRDLRRALVKMGGELIDAPQVSSQANDVVVDPGMEHDEPELPPNEDRIYGPN